MTACCGHVLYYLKLWVVARSHLVARVKCTVAKLNIQLPSEFTASITDYKQHVNLLLINACLACLWAWDENCWKQKTPIFKGHSIYMYHLINIVATPYKYHYCDISMLWISWLCTVYSSRLTYIITGKWKKFLGS